MTQISSIAGLSKALDRSWPVMKKWSNDPRWPFSRKGPWSISEVPKMIEWLGLNAQEDRSAGDMTADEIASVTREQRAELVALAREERILDNKLKAAREQVLANELARFSGKYIDRELHQQETAAKLRAVRIGMQNLTRSLAQRLADETEPRRVQVILEVAFRALFNGFCNQAQSIEPVIAESKLGVDAK